MDEPPKRNDEFAQGSTEENEHPTLSHTNKVTEQATPEPSKGEHPKLNHQETGAIPQHAIYPESKPKTFIKKTYTRLKTLSKLGLLAATLATPCTVLEQSHGYIQRYVGSSVIEGLRPVYGTPDLKQKIVQDLNLPALGTIKAIPKKKGGTTYMLDRNNNLIARFPNYSQGGEYKDLSQKIIWATKAAEDTRFDYHHGADLGSFITAMAGNVANKITGANVRSRGASTITQQLADKLLEKNHTVTRQGCDSDLFEEVDGKLARVVCNLANQESKVEESAEMRKVREWKYAAAIEKTLSKEEIITQFLNRVDFGFDSIAGKIQGIQPAAEFYFGKSAKDVDLTEAVLLTAMIKKPTYGKNAYVEWNNSLNGKYSAWLNNRADYIIGSLEKLRDLENLPISEAEIDEVRTRLNYSQYNFRKPTKLLETIRAKGYVTQVKNRLTSINGTKELPGNIIVKTTLDSEIQEFLEEKFTSTVTAMRKEANFPHPERLNGAAIVIDTKSMEVLALVGGFDTKEDQQQRATLDYFLPGSLNKMIVLSYALENGLTALDEEFLDAPKTFQMDYGSHIKDYTPQNFKNKWTRVPLTLEQAAIRSKNGIFTQLSDRIIQVAGQESPRDYMRSLGIDIATYELSTVLGTNSTNLLRQSGAYLGLITGEAVKFETGDINVNFVKTVTHADKIHYVHPIETRRVLTPETVRQISSTMQKIVQEGTGTRAKMKGYDHGGKTSTVDNGLSFIGFEYALHTLVAVQFRSDYPSETGTFKSKYTGGRYAAPFAKEIMEYVASR
jgi:penicillin-binding protein 1A